jgi:hypothetical protein
MTTATQKVSNYGFLTASAPGNSTAPTTYTFKPSLGSNGEIVGSIYDATAAQLTSYTQSQFQNDKTRSLLNFANGSQVIILNSEVKSFILALAQTVPSVNKMLLENAVTAGPGNTVTPPVTPPVKPVATPSATNVTTTTNTTATFTANTTVTTNSVTKTTVTSITNSTSTVKDQGSVGKVTAPAKVSVPNVGGNGKITIGSTIKTPPVITDPGELNANIPPIDFGNIATPPDINTFPPAIGLTSAVESAAGAATAQDQAMFTARADWRVRLSLAPGSNYLYNDPSGNSILQPLKYTDGVIFPYTPAIQVNYAANYDAATIIHSNYKIFQYQNSSVDQVQITSDFTAQDVKEANYVLAVIHFFRTMTKMFYGQDSDPKNGTPPPLCYLYGMGGYQFDALPLAISGFSYSLPQDVDYIKTSGASAAGTPQPSVDNSATNSGRLGPNIAPGGEPAGPVYGNTPASLGESTTWVPTKINISISCLPIMSRNQVSNYFSLKDYASGNLLLGTRRPGGGMW